MIEHHLTINSQGNVWLSHYGYNKEFSKQKLRSEQFCVSVEQANYILAAVGLAFSRTTMPILERDAGEWKLEITDLEDKVELCMNSLGADRDPENLSGIIRKELKRKDLILFDGLAKF